MAITRLRFGPLVSIPPLPLFLPLKRFCSTTAILFSEPVAPTHQPTICGKALIIQATRGFLETSFGLTNEPERANDSPRGRTPKTHSPGLFSLQLDESTTYKIIWNGTNEYWSSVPWNPRKSFFNFVPEMNVNYLYNYTFFSDSTESYLSRGD